MTNHSVLKYYTSDQLPSSPVVSPRHSLTPLISSPLTTQNAARILHLTSHLTPLYSSIYISSMYILLLTPHVSLHISNSSLNTSNSSLYTSRFSIHTPQCLSSSLSLHLPLLTPDSTHLPPCSFFTSQNPFVPVYFPLVLLSLLSPQVPVACCRRGARGAGEPLALPAG